MKYLRKVKSISLMIVLIMVLQLVLPISFTGAELVNIVPTDRITKISILVKQTNGSLKDITEITNYQPQNGDTVTLKFDIILEDKHSFGDGYKLTYELPSIFANAKGSGNMGTVGTFGIEGGKVVVTFNEKIRDEVNQGVEVNDASFFIEANYSETNEELNYVLKLPGQADIQLNFKPKVGDAITKDGTPENNGKSSNFISWVVDLNTELDNLSNASFKDVLIQQTPGKHTYIQSSLKVYELNVNAKGIVPGNPTTEAAITATFNAENTELTFNLPDGKKAYRIEYKTKMDESDSDAGSAIYKNTASLINNGVTVSAPITSETVTWGPPLEKSVSGYGSYGASANWVVKYNYNRKTISTDKAILIDKITGNHKIEDASKVKVYNENNVEIDNTLYSVQLDADHKGYTLNFKQDVTEPYQIKYTTIKTDQFVSGGTVSNKIIRENDKKESTATFNYSNSAIIKSEKGIDYNNKTIKWEIKVNQDSYIMDNVFITDIYAGEGMKYKAGSLVVNDLSPGKYIFTDNGLSGFTFQVTTGTPISVPFTITYETDYKINDIGNNDRTYKNTSSIEWYVGAKKYNSSSSDEAVINAEQKANGYKKGAYNYETKEFKWTVVMNYNYNTLTNAILKDTLPEGQQIIKESIVVCPVTLKADGTIASRLNPISPLKIEFPDDNKLEITLGEVTGPYEITYTSKDVDGIFPKTTGNVKIKNNAELLNNSTPNAVWSDEVTVAYTNETIKKEGKGYNGTSKIDWNFRLNYSQSNLSEVKIVDTVGKDTDGNPNQFILEDSFKVYKVKLTGEKKSGNPSETKTLVTEKYKVVVDNLKGTFTLTFDDTIAEAYYVEYQSIFLGAPGSSVENTAKLTYNGITSGIEETSVKEFNYTFAGSGSAKKVQLNLIKEDKDSGDKLEGARFALYNSNNIKLTEVTTNNNGEVLIPYKLGEGNYTLKEIEAPTGYLKSADINFVLKVSTSVNGIQTVAIDNTKIRQAIELTKTDDASSPLEGVEFELRLKDGLGNYNIVPGYENLKTDAVGKIYVGDLLTPGDYQLIETKAIDGYWLDSTPVDFIVIKDQTVATSKTMKNTRQGNLIINKVDSANNNPLPGAIFKLYAINDTTFTKPLYTSLSTGTDGKTEFINVKYGEYILKETTAPNGYVVKPSDDGNKITVNSATQDITIKNDKINQAVKLTKVDVDNGTKLGRAVFTLHHPDGTLVEKDEDGFKLPESFTTDENGEIKVNKLTPGSYYFIEKEAPNYYLQPVGVNNKTSVFTITPGQTNFTNVDMTNKRGEGSIIIKKVDAADNSIILKGVEFILRNSDGVIKVTSSTDANGKIEFTGLPYDTYILTEKTAHKDYVINTLPQEIVLDGETDGILKEVTVENTKKDHSVKLIKYNAGKTLKLEGAIFELRKEIAGVYEVVKGIDVKKLTTDENGEINLKDLPVGKYQLIETSAAAGYRLNSDPVEFEIFENQTVTTIVEKLNSRKSTGGGGDKPEIPKVPEVKPGSNVANILINKIDKDSNPLEGAEFTLYDENGVEIGTAVSDENGYVLFDNLPLGKYSIQETKAPTNYELSQEVKTVNITESTTYSYTITNVLSEKATGGESGTENSTGGGGKTEQEFPKGQTTLPNTGSIFNTTLLAVIGLILIITGIVSIKLNKIRS